MGATEILWAVAGVVAACLWTWGGFFMSETPRKVRTFFLLAPTPIVLMTVWYIVTTSDDWKHRLVIAAIVGGLAGINTVETLRWVRARESRVNTDKERTMAERWLQLSREITDFVHLEFSDAPEVARISPDTQEEYFRAQVRHSQKARAKFESRFGPDILIALEEMTALGIQTSEIDPHGTNRLSMVETSKRVAAEAKKIMKRLGGK